MIPATTPTFILTLKNAEGYLTNTTSLKAYLRQRDVLVVKEMDKLVIDPESDTVGITLTQEESNKFLYKNGKIEIQLHGLLEDGITAWKTYVVDVPVDRTLTKGVIS